MTTRITALVQHKDVVDVVGVETADRGRARFDDGYVYNAREERQAEHDKVLLWAMCSDEGSETFWVSVILNRGMIARSGCTCSSADACEHVAAVLYAWIDEPEMFEEAGSWRTALSSWSKDRLLTLIHSLGDLSVENDAFLQAEVEAWQRDLPEDIQDRMGLMGYAPSGLVAELASELVEEGFAKQAEGLVIKRIGGGRSGVMVDWLIEYYEQVSNYSGALMWARRRLDEVPRSAYFATVWSIGQRLGVWTELRPVLLARLKRMCFPEYIKALLLEGRLVESLDAYEEGVEQGKRVSDATRLRLAEIAELLEPERAMAIYSELIDGLIERRTREYYRIAAHLLARVELLYTQLGRAGEWQLRFSEFIGLYPRRHVLFEELERADLLEID